MKAQRDVILAVCDSDILGKTFSEGELILEVSKSFYGVENCSVDKVKDMSREATIINATGEKIIKLLIKEGYIEEDKILKVQGVPHAQMVKIL